MSSKYFVQLSLGKKTFKARVPTANCEYVDDFKIAIKNTFSPLLDRFAPAQLSLFESDGTTEIDPMTPMADVFITHGKPLIVKVEPAPLLSISTRRHRDYKHSKAIHSSRSFLTSIALSLEAKYELEKREPDKPATFGDVLWNKKHDIAVPKPPHTKPLGQMFSRKKWELLRVFNDEVNKTLHLELDENLELIVPADFIIFHKMMQEIAKDAGIVEAEADLTVKDEGSESGGGTSPEADNPKPLE